MATQRYLLRALLFCGMALLACNARAVPILVGTWSGSSGDSTEKIAVRNAIIAYNLVNDPDLPQIFDDTVPPPGTLPNLLAGWAEFVGKTNVANGPDEFEWTAPNTYSNYYVMSKYGEGGASFDHALHYMSANDLLKYNPNGSDAPNGLSHYWIWASGPISASVPDAGATFGLLLAGMLGIVAFRRRT